MSITNPDAQPAPTARDRADMERLAAGQDAALNDLMERHADAGVPFSLPDGRQ